MRFLGSAPSFVKPVPIGSGGTGTGTPITVSAGASSAGQIPALNPSGVLDVSFLPSTVWTTANFSPSNYAPLANPSFTGTATAPNFNTPGAFISTASGGVALELGPNSAIRDISNGASIMYFDVSVGGTANGTFVWRSSNAGTQLMTLGGGSCNINVGVNVASLATQTQVTAPNTPKAWVLFNNSGQISASFNVASVTVNASGDYTVNFATAFPDANYAYTCGMMTDSAFPEVLVRPSGGTKTTTACRFITLYTANGAQGNTGGTTEMSLVFFHA